MCDGKASEVHTEGVRSPVLRYDIGLFGRGLFCRSLLNLFFDVRGYAAEGHTAEVMSPVLRFDVFMSLA